MTPEYLQKERFGLCYEVLVPTSVGLNPRNNTTQFDESEPMFEPWVRAAAPGKVMIDVGAHSGAYALPALAAGAVVLAYEPSDDGRRILMCNLLRNCWGSRAFLSDRVLWDGTRYPEELARQVFGFHYPADLQELRFSTIDFEVLAREASWDIGRVDAIKIDVEGAEFGVLLGARSTLVRWRPRLFIEDHEGLSDDPAHEICAYPARIGSERRMRELLEGLGYSIDVRVWDAGRKFWVCEAA